MHGTFLLRMKVFSSTFVSTFRSQWLSGLEITESLKMTDHKFCLMHKAYANDYYIDIFLN